MAIVRLQHVGIAVRDFRGTCERLARSLGLRTRDFRADQGKGMQHDARILLGNDCWLHVVHNWNPEARVYRFAESRGPGLEHIALETDDIEADVSRLRELGIPIFEDRIVDANDGYEAFVYPDDAVGFTVELIQPHATSWVYPEDAYGEPVSETLGIKRLQHIGAAVRDVRAATERLERLFDLRGSEWLEGRGDGRAREARIPLGNACWLCLAEPQSPGSRVGRFLAERGEGLEHIALETESIEHDLSRLREIGIPFLPNEPDGREAFVASGVGFTVQLVAPREATEGG